MELQLVNFEQSNALKKVGFPQRFISSFGWFNKDGILFNSVIDASMEEVSDECVAPSLELVAKWLREDCKLYIEIDKHENFYYCKILSLNGIILKNLSFKKFDTYEDALSAGIDQSIEMLQRDNH